MTATALLGLLATGLGAPTILLGLYRGLLSPKIALVEGATALICR